MINYVGIDLGTTFSSISVLKKGSKEPKTLELEGPGKKTMPSVVYYGGSEPIVGTLAKKYLYTQPDCTVELAKSYLGSDKKWVIKGKEVTPVDVSADILKRLMHFYHLQYNEDYECVITCPANYKQDKKRLLKDAAEKAGIKVKCLLNEPTAAALTYFCDNEESIGKTLVIFDLGGGTFDVTVATSLSNENGIPQYYVRSTSGAEHLGGADWDHRVYQMILRQCSDKTGLSQYTLQSNPKDNAGMKKKSENYKILLSNGDLEDDITIFGDGGRTVDISIPVSEFESFTSDLLDKVLKKFDEALESAYMDKRPDLPPVTKESIYKIVMVGGSCRMPQVIDGIIRRYPIFKGKVILREPEESICKGASIYCSRVEDGNDYSFRDKLSNTIGIGCFVDEKNLNQERLKLGYYSQKVPGRGYLMCSNLLYKGTITPYKTQKEYILNTGKKGKFELTIFQNDVDSDSGEEYTDPKKCVTIYKDEIVLKNSKDQSKVILIMSFEVSGDIAVEIIDEDGNNTVLPIRGNYKLSDSKIIDQMIGGIIDLSMI